MNDLTIGRASKYTIFKYTIYQYFIELDPLILGLSHLLCT